MAGLSTFSVQLFGAGCWMSQNHHEQYDRTEIPLPSDRSVGLTFAAVALIVAFLWRTHHTVASVALGVAGALAAAAILVPTVLRPLNIVWFKFGLLLHRFVSPVVMLLMFAIAIVPFGFIMQLRADPLRKNRLPNAKSYWIDREQRSGVLPSMRNQF